ncbi:hypothetical protein CVT25_013311 [Psilocybe cyanescens]|uniref:Uncharacterized protein n=1 Tax=Psilocybe cyanescens TaxID=93625 RepID=A0A409XHF3_PSICY|nr:hypothetical protein CVT25_013311 [Psilocybe cyanescens]
MINTITSPKGGVFSVLVDGFDTGSTIDTFVGPGDLFMPTCYPVQIPPFGTTPPDFGSRNDHTVSLIYIGASSDAPEGTESNIQFDSFAIPNHDNFSDSQPESKGDGMVIGAIELWTVPRRVRADLSVFQINILSIWARPDDAVNPDQAYLKAANKIDAKQRK